MLPINGKDESGRPQVALVAGSFSAPGAPAAPDPPRSDTSARIGKGQALHARSSPRCACRAAASRPTSPRRRGSDWRAQSAPGSPRAERSPPSPPCAPATTRYEPSTPPARANTSSPPAPARSTTTSHAPKHACRSSRLAGRSWPTSPGRQPSACTASVPDSRDPTGDRASGHKPKTRVAFATSRNHGSRRLSSVRARFRAGAIHQPPDRRPRPGAPPDPPAQSAATAWREVVRPQCP